MNNRADSFRLSRITHPRATFWAMILHGSRGNSNPGRARRGYAVRYIGDDVRYDPRIGTADALHYAELEPGAPMATDHYPVVWPRPA